MSSLWVVDPGYRTLQGGSRLAGPRVETYRWELLALDGTPLGDLDGVTDGSVDQSNATTLRTSGSLTHEAPEDVDWLHSLVRAWYRADFPDGTSAEWPLGTFVPAVPSSRYGDGTVSRDVDLQSLLQVLDEDAVTQTYGLPVGAVVTTEVRSLIASAGTVGGGSVSGTDSAETLRTAMVWEPGTSKLRICNDLLDAINYFALSTDGLGSFILAPYQPPTDRAPVWTFDDVEPIDSPAFDHTRDYYNTPNRVVGIAQGSGDAPALTSTASNTNPNDPLSIPARGRTVTHVEDNIEATSQAVLDGIVKRRLVELSSVSSVLEVDHAPLDLAPNDVVTFRRDDLGIVLRGVVQKTSLQCTEGALMRSTIREVTS